MNDREYKVKLMFADFVLSLLITVFIVTILIFIS